jgi:RecA-family ATPase
MALEFFTEDTVMNIPPQAYLIEGILPEGMCMLAAPPKLGKSLVALDMGMSLAAGLDWMGIPSRQVSVLYILSEAKGTLPGRVLAWRKWHNFPTAEITFACGATNMLDFKRVKKDLQPHIPEQGLIVWDTLQRNTEGADENDVRAMGAVIKTCDWIYEQHDTTSLLVHHSTKESTVSAGGAKVISSWYRGHSSLLGAIDMGMTIENDELICKAARHDEPFDPIPLTRQRVEVRELGKSSIALGWGRKKAEYR